jgi:hypothetical protein
MNWRQAFGCLAVIAAAVSSAAAQEAGFAASAVADENGTTTVITAPPGGAAAVGAGDNGTATIILGPGGGATTFTVTGVAWIGDNAAHAKVTYLGVSTSPPPEALAEQLKLPKGVGLLVDFVDAKGPAAAAGIRKNDVLTKLDDQLLTSPQHLAVLVRMHKPKDKVALTLCREAREQKVAAELGESEEAAREADIGLQPVLPQPTARGNAMQQMFSRMNAGAGAATTSSSSFSDGEHTLTVTASGREKHLLATDRDGNVLFNGPVTTEEQRKAVPPEILKKFETMEKSMRVEVREESRGTVSLIEDGLTLTLTTESGKQSVVAKDADGKVIFQGPVDTQEQRAKMPEKVRTKLERLWKSCAAVWQSSQD